MFVQEVRECAEPFRAMANDCGGPAIARPKPKLLERGINAFVVRRIHIVRVPSERGENRFQFRHRKHHSVGKVELAVISIYQDAEVIEVFRRRKHHAFPYRTLLQFAIARHCI